MRRLSLISIKGDSNDVNAHRPVIQSHRLRIGFANSANAAEFGWRDLLPWFSTRSAGRASFNFDEDQSLPIFGNDVDFAQPITPTPFSDRESSPQKILRGDVLPFWPGLACHAYPNFFSTSDNASSKSSRALSA